MNTYPVGSLVVITFCLVTRPLTSAEQAAFEAGNGLPAGIGVAPAGVWLDLYPPSTIAQLLSTPNVTSVASGLFTCSVQINQAGLWRYRGRGTDSVGNPLAATPDYSFRAYRSFPEA